MANLSTHPSRSGLMPSLYLALVLTLVLGLGASTPPSVTLFVALAFLYISLSLLFALSSAPLMPSLRRWGRGTWLEALGFPVTLAMLVYVYVASQGLSPLHGTGWLLPLLLVLPVIYYRLCCPYETALGWRDVPGIVLCLMAAAMPSYPFVGTLPPGYSGVALYPLLTLCVVVYAMAAVRGNPGVVIAAQWRSAYLRTALSAWAIYFPFAIAVGLGTGFIQWHGYSESFPVVVWMFVLAFTKMLLSTALPEELLFRAIAQNLFHQMLVQGGNWQRWLWVSAVGGSLLALLAGYAIGGAFAWLPLLMALGLSVSAVWLSRRHAGEAGAYTALLFGSMLFGLAHYHTHSTAFVALALVAGWCYGYVYWRTGNVLYSALVHALVNTAPALLGLVLVR